LNFLIIQKAILIESEELEELGKMVLLSVLFQVVIQENYSSLKELLKQKLQKKNYQMVKK
jgi:hypothetical protein